MGGLAAGDGIARLGSRLRASSQARPGRELGCAARADVGVERAARQAVDRRCRAARACAELSAARAGGAAGVAAARASAVLSRGRRSMAATVTAPGPPFGLTLAHGQIAHTARCRAGPLPLSGVRVLDFSWVIAGPTTTRYLAAMGAEVIKVEAPGRGDPGRASELHTVLGQAKRGIVLDLKKPEAVAVARALAAKSDVLVENFATGVMDRLGLGAEALAGGQSRPDVSFRRRDWGAPGRKRAAVAYGTLLQCYAGFAGLNRHPGCAAARRFRVAGSDVRADAGVRRRGGVVAAAARWRRGARRFLDDRGDAVDDGRAAAGDAARRAPKPAGNASDRHAPHGACRCAGDDDVDQRRVTERRGMAGAVRGGAGVGGAWPALGLRERMRATRHDR